MLSEDVNSKPFDLLTDILEDFYQKMAHRLKEVTEMENHSVEQDFPVISHIRCPSRITNWMLVHLFIFSLTGCTGAGSSGNRTWGCSRPSRILQNAGCGLP
jgi:hypothetical protein